MKFYYQILTTPTADTPGTQLFLHFPDKRYIFGQIAEGSQRICTENGTKLINVTDIFLTGRMEWRNTGGLIGMILSLADGLASSVNAQEEHFREKEANRREITGDHTEVERKKGSRTDPAQDGKKADQRDLTVHGSKNLSHTLATARRFVFRQQMHVYTQEYDLETTARGLPTESTDPYEKPTWSDHNIKVWAMPISPSSVPPPCPQSPRKRSHEEFREDYSLVQQDQQNYDQIARQSVVASMFNSSWSLDALVETRLADVKMPAEMFVRNPMTKDLEKYLGPTPGSSEDLPEVNVFVRTPWPGASVNKIPSTTKCEEALSYIIKSHEIRGRFDPQKAQQLGVKRGPDWGNLTKGLSVISQDGKLVTPDMVLGPSKAGKGLVIADLPTLDYVKSFVNRPEWKSPFVNDDLEAFLWILGPGVGDDPRLLEFVAAMPNCKHIVSSTDYCPNYLAMQSVAGSAVRLAKLNPDHYPVPIHHNLRIPQTQSVSNIPIPSPTAGTNQSPFEPAEPGLIVNMEPEFGLDRSEVVPRLNTASILEHLPASAQRRARIVATRLERPEYQQKLQEFTKDLPGANVEVMTLGTGSSAPSKYRNVSSTLLHVPGQGYYLFDCGEGTLGQLKRMFSPEQLREVFQNLRLIWISHLHADHHLGTVSVIRAWYQENYPDGTPQSDEVEMDMHKILQEKRLFLVSEPMMIEWLEEYAGVEDFGFAKMTPLSAFPFQEYDEITTSFLYRHCRPDGSYPGREFRQGKPATTELIFTDEDSILTSLLRKATGLSDLLTTYVSHCRGAMAVSLVFPDGFKASFSGDCRPSPSFARIGQDSTLLIHEATFDDNMRGSARAKKHSTSAEALDIGRQMRARSILLTHFSQRYQKLVIVGNSATAAETFYDEPHDFQQKAEENPVDKDSQEDLASDVPSRFTPRIPIPPPPTVPVVTAVDYMRVRVGDMFKLEAYAPAVQRLFTMIEKSAGLAALKSRMLAEELATAKKANKGKQRGNRAPSPPRAIPPTSPKMQSVWDAPDSDAEWASDGVYSPGRGSRRKS
ncbi:hypothetical protein BDW59DRAFT_149566 [Aspergillus cavernicola]|uniref:ribonuclease Z n=1 Tax=Aspergillus cavernicola TaxID=176166 RepID=A0ABR4I519_9EURO